MEMTPKLVTCFVVIPQVYDAFLVCFSFESSNSVHGRTLHPMNKDLTPGGSSSGEGALIASGGSLLGFGSDSGGSVRVPAHVCGIVGMMPTRNRISNKGHRGIWKLPMSYAKQ